MTKKHFIALADAVREHNRIAMSRNVNMYRGTDDNIFLKDQLETLAEFCQRQNPRFNRSRWLSYIRGECGPGGGQIKGGVKR